MEKPKPPGIALERISLLACEIGDILPEAPNSYGLRMTDFSRTESGDAKMLVVRAGFDLMSNIENPRFKFRCSFEMVYSLSSDGDASWDLVKDHVAIAHLIPFLREFVSNMTARLPFPMLMIDPVNAHVLLEEYKTRPQEAIAIASVANKR